MHFLYPPGNDIDYNNKKNDCLKNISLSNVIITLHVIPSSNYVMSNHDGGCGRGMCPTCVEHEAENYG